MQKNIAPVRKIGKDSSSLKNLVYSAKNEKNNLVESSLERDFLEILEFDNCVDYYCEQPLEIEYLDNGVSRTYIPDVFVSFRESHSLTIGMKKTIFEIEYRSTLKEKWNEFKPKFKAAKKYAEEQGWGFRILTEREIRTTYLNNIKFLLQYKNAKNVNTNGCRIIQDTLQDLKRTCPEELIIRASRDKKMQAELIYCLWYLVANNFIGCNLTVPLNMRTELWSLYCPESISVSHSISREKVKERYGLRIAKQRFDTYRKKSEQGNVPLSVVQIDHTKVDIILVDELYRKPIGRPYITLAIDVYSRIILGFYVSFDSPGAVETGMCIANSILPKEILLAKYDIDGEWPCWGVMKTIHADNEKEFRGNMLNKMAKEYGINLEWSLVEQPNWGRHIESLLGTLLLKEMQNLLGTTFSNTTERQNYNLEKNATLTLKEFENWLTTFFVNVYHNRLHDGIGTTPLAKYNEGIFGSAVQVGCGLPERIFNEKKLHLDFLPYVERSIQQYGVQIDHIQYYHDVLRKWINSLEVSKGKSRIRRKFIFKRDPRDISIVFFYDPDLNEYFEIPYRNTSHPAITIWEYREIEKTLLEQGKKHIDENAIFEGYQRLRDIEANAIGKKCEVQRHKKNCKREHSLSNSVLKRKPPLTIDESTPKEQAKFISVEIKPFDDLDTYI
jgi:transposase InsO family protein